MYSLGLVPIDPLNIETTARKERRGYSLGFLPIDPLCAERKAGVQPGVGAYRSVKH